MAPDSTCSRFVRTSYLSNNWYARKTMKAHKKIRKMGEWWIGITDSRPAESCMRVFFCLMKKSHSFGSDRSNGWRIRFMIGYRLSRLIFVLSVLISNVKCIDAKHWQPISDIFIFVSAWLLTTDYQILCFATRTPNFILRIKMFWSLFERKTKKQHNISTMNSTNI